MMAFVTSISILFSVGMSVYAEDNTNLEPYPTVFATPINESEYTFEIPISITYYTKNGAALQSFGGTGAIKATYNRDTRVVYGGVTVISDDGLIKSAQGTITCTTSTGYEEPPHLVYGSTFIPLKKLVLDFQEFTGVYVPYGGAIKLKTSGTITGIDEYGSFIGEATVPVPM